MTAVSTVKAVRKGMSEKWKERKKNCNSRWEVYI
jgi:hypothetical protein